MFLAVYTSLDQRLYQPNTPIKWILQEGKASLYNKDNLGLVCYEIFLFVNPNKGDTNHRNYRRNANYCSEAKQEGDEELW